VNATPAVTPHTLDLVLGIRRQAAQLRRASAIPKPLNFLLNLKLHKLAEAKAFIERGRPKKEALLRAESARLDALRAQATAELERRDRAAATGGGCSGPNDGGSGGRAAATGDGCSGPNDEDRDDNHGDSDNDGDDCDSDGYGPGEGYYPDGGYGYARDLADADAWEPRR
jgi:hypothetical protein